MRHALAELGVLTLLSCGLVAPACAQWKWISPSGVVQYSDQPPPSTIAARNILARPAAAAPGPTASSASQAAGQIKGQDSQAARELQSKLDEDKRAKEAAQRLQQQVSEQARLANCLQARRQLQALDSGLRVRQVDAQGNRDFLDDAQIAAQRRQAAAMIAANCP
jgi:hypothetical protein